MERLERRIARTSDGSYTLFVPSLNEHYHSINGAVQESKHVFIKYGLLPLLKTREQLNILDIGFGTGLNALLTLINNRHIPIYYYAVEAYPIAPEHINTLYYPQHLNQPDEKASFELLHQAEWGKEVAMKPNFKLLKLKQRIEDFEFPDKVDLVYYDAFAPDTQPELWTTEIFNKLFRLMNPGAVLVTYCAKGQVKRNLKAAGFPLKACPAHPASVK